MERSASANPSQFRFDCDLIDPGELIFDRVLNRHDVVLGILSSAGPNRASSFYRNPSGLSQGSSHAAHRPPS